MTSSALNIFELSEPENSPEHIAVIMDGNRRWAKGRGLPPIAGHFEGVRALFRTVKAAADRGVKVVTAYGFSTENWDRTLDEVDGIIQVIVHALKEYRDVMIEEGVAFHVIGDTVRFPLSLQEELKQVSQMTEHGSRIDLVVALNYGGRDEICRAMGRMLQASTTKLAPEDITEDKVSQYLDTAQWPDPSLVVRTSGEVRLSNFLLWQLSYAEVIASPILWPDFDKNHLDTVLIEYHNRHRRLGV